MERALILTTSLRLTSIVCVFDQAIYAKAIEIKWKEPEKFRCCVVMMGMFHLLMVYMAILHKRFADAGLKDTIIQSGMTAEGSIETALKGKHYNRGVRLYKIFYEALMRNLISHMCTDKCTEEKFNSLMNPDSTDGSGIKILFDDIKEDIRFEELYHKYLDIRLKWGDERNTLRGFWVTYLDMVELLLNTIYAVRSGSWNLLLECIKEMLPYIFAYDHVNYSRYLTPMLGDMLALPDDYPEIYQAFLEGKFAAQLTQGKMFSRVETDKVIEMTLNKDTKSASGTTGFSTNVNAVRRWELNASYRSALRECFHQHVMHEPQNYQHKDLTPSRIKRDEANIQSVMSVLDDAFVNPFSEMSLVSISTGIEATDKVATDLFRAYKVGKEAMQEFITNRLCKEPKLNLFDPIKKMKLATFSTMSKTKICKLKGKEISLKSSKDLFCKVTIIAQKRSLNLNQLFQYPLGPLPLALAETDGTLKKSPKSALLHKLEGPTEPVEVIPGEYAFIADGMACVRQIKASQLTYSEFAAHLLSFIIGCSKSAKRVDVVFDVYVDNSIKDVERTRRSHGELRLKKIIPTAQIKQWNLLLSSNENKNKLTAFIVDHWKTNATKIGQKEFYVTSGEKVFKITSTEHREVDELESDHQEADTRMLLHAKHSSYSYNNIVIYTPDADVFIIALSKTTEISSNMYMLTGVKNARRIIDLGAVANYVYNTLNKSSCEKAKVLDALLGYHCFTGCDSISSFAGRGKIKPLKLMLSANHYVEAFSSLGTTNTVLNEVSTELQRFVCHMYGRRSTNSEVVNVNDTRYFLYCQKGGKVSCDTLPPCSNVLDQHIARSNYQSQIWRKATTSLISVSNPINHGWYMNNDLLDIKWMTCKPAPEEVNWGYFDSVNSLMWNKRMWN